MPFDKKTGNPAFVQFTKYNEAWPLVLEKAWAKLHGSYHRALGGNISLALTHLISRPTTVIKHEEKFKKTIFKDLKQKLESLLEENKSEKGKWMFFGTTNENVHSYAVRGIFNLTVKENNVEKEITLLQLRNRWTDQVINSDTPRSRIESWGLSKT